MTTTGSPQAAPVSSVPLTYDQLHERACVICDRKDGDLVPAGHRTQDGMVWAVKACPEHRQAEQ